MSWEILLKILEGLSYLCAIGVLVAAFKGLGQIKVGLGQIEMAKKNARLESKRDSLRCANEAVASFFNMILPTYEKGSRKPEDLQLLKSVRVTENGKINVEGLSKKIKEQYDFTKEDQLKDFEITVLRAFEPVRETFNLLEAFTTTFTSGLADEKAAYVAMGQAFCKMVKPYDQALAYFNNQGFYKNTSALYNLWNKRLNKDKIIQEVALAETETELAQSELDQKRKALAKIKKEISSIEDKGIVSIGTGEVMN